jgi:hypothetical protein
MPTLASQMPTVGFQMPDTESDGAPLPTEPTDPARRRIHPPAGPVMSSGLFGSGAAVYEDHGLRRRTFSAYRYSGAVKSGVPFN